MKQRTDPCGIATGLGYLTNSGGGWVALRTQVRHELIAASALVGRAVETYIPLAAANRSTDMLPLFPGYVFARVRAGSDDVLRIRSAPGIAYVLPRGGLPTIVPDEIIDVVRVRLAEYPKGIRRPELQHGERVQIIDGPFRSMEAVFDRRLSADGRVRLLLNFAQRTVHVNVEENLLKRV